MEGQSCSNAQVMGTASAIECLEAVTTLLVVTKDNFKFASLSEAQTLSSWNTAIADGDIVPLYQMYELTPANTEETFYESRNFKKRVGKATKITTFENYLSLCSHKALKSYQASMYTRVFEITEDDEVIAVKDGLGLKGQKIKDFNVGIRNAATLDKVPFTLVTMTYGDYEELENNGVIFKPNFDANSALDSIYAANVDVTGATATTINFSLTTCEGMPVTGVADGSFKCIAGSTGAVQSITVAEDDAAANPGVYTATGTSLVSGLIGLDDIVAVSTVSYNSSFASFTVA